MAAARARTHSPHARRGAAPAAPRHPRRVSGPLRPVTAPTAAPATAVRVPVRRGRTTGFERVRALPDHRLVDGLLRSRAWIVLIGLLLGGIVAMQVSLLKLNAGISRAVQTTATLERQNADMEDAIARLSSGERVREGAAAAGMIAPRAGDVGFLRARARDAELAAERMQPPSAQARAVTAPAAAEAASTAPGAGGVVVAGQG